MALSTPRRCRSHPRRRAVPMLRALRAVLLLAAVLLAGCSSIVAGNPVRVPGQQTPAQTAPATASSPAPVPPALDRFYSQKLSWGPCVDYATTPDDKSLYSSASLQCARLTVPLAYDDPTGKTITVGVLRKQATGPGTRLGSVLFNPGGPGASGMELVAQLAVYRIAGDLNERFDLVGFDPRGVGSSRPVIQCQTDAQRDAERAISTRTRTLADVAAANAQNKQIAEDCVRNSGTPEGINGAKFLANVGTRDVARDMDVLRAVLGDRQLTYVGYSYGTRLGYVYAEQFPRNVRAMILDGAVAPDMSPATELVNQAKGFQSAFDGFAAWCANRPACVLGTDPAKATAVFQHITRPLLDHPLPLPDGRVLSYDDAITGTIQALYAQTFWPQLASALLNMTKGDGTGVMALADEYEGRDASGHYSNLQAAFTAIRCMDDPRITDPAKAQKLAEEYAAAAPFMDNGDPPRAVKDVCAFWPAKPTLSPHRPDITGLAPVLVISTTGDPATPYQAGVDLARALHGSLLTVDGTRHTAFLGAGIACVDDIGTEYLVNLTLPKSGTTCRS